MIKYISKIIYFFLNVINLIFKIIFKRDILVWIKFYIEQDAYKKVKLKTGKELVFFSPNFLVDILIRDFYSKEPETLQWIESFKKKEKIIFWDIGSNIGLYSIYAAVNFENIEVVSFEPSTSNLRILSRNISINNLENKIKIFQLPLGVLKNKFLNFNERKFNEGESHNSLDKNIDFEGKKINSNNRALKIMIEKSKKIKWSKKLYTRRQLDDLYTMNNGSTINLTNINRYLRATITKKFKPFIIADNKKFFLTNEK